MEFEFSAEQKVWQRTIHQFVEAEVKVNAREVDESGEFNWIAVRKMGPIGLLGLTVPEEFGGSDVDPISFVIAMKELGWGCGSTGLAIAAHNGLGCAPIVAFGTSNQKKQFLSSVVTGKNGLAALALTEPGAGSDLQGGISTKAIKSGNDWIINGSKMWITNASIADYIITLARTEPFSGPHSLSMIIVPSKTPGLVIHPPEKKMGLHGSMTNAISYEDVRVPLENLLGEKGKGLSQTLQILDGGRISIGSLCLGLALAAYEKGIAYAKERIAFGKPIAEQQALQWMLADAATEMEAANLLIYQAAWLKHKGKPYSRYAALAKLFASEMAERVTRNMIQIHGGYGYSREYEVERIYRDARLMTIGEGTSEIQRLVIARDILQEK
ncbi:acyl-CoA dehydrogenase family protein [Chloroflexota bacterium]